MSYLKVKLGKNAPEQINAIVEIPYGSHNKYELDEETGVIKLDRVLHSPLFFPFEYGFIPETHADDGDHLDILVVNNSPLFVGCLVEVRPVGVLKMSDENGIDDKIISVVIANPHFQQIAEIDNLHPHVLREISHFFEQYKKLEKDKTVEVKNFDSREKAIEIITKAHAEYLRKL
jgi:inorganic pyrophosphatase